MRLPGLLCLKLVYLFLLYLTGVCSERENKTSKHTTIDVLIHRYHVSISFEGVCSPSLSDDTTPNDPPLGMSRTMPLLTHATLADPRTRRNARNASTYSSHRGHARTGRARTNKRPAYVEVDPMSSRRARNQPSPRKRFTIYVLLMCVLLHLSTHVLPITNLRMFAYGQHDYQSHYASCLSPFMYLAAYMCMCPFMYLLLTH